MLIGETRLRTNRVMGAVAFGLVTAAGFGAGAALMAARLTEPHEVAELENLMVALQNQNEDLRAEAAELREEQEQTEAPMEVLEAMTAEAERSLALQAAIVDLVKERDRLAKDLAALQSPFEDGALVEILNEEGEPLTLLDSRNSLVRNWRLRRVEGGYRIEDSGGGLALGLDDRVPFFISLHLTSDKASPSAVWRFVSLAEGQVILNAETGWSLDFYDSQHDGGYRRRGKARFWRVRPVERPRRF